MFFFLVEPQLKNSHFLKPAISLKTVVKNVNCLILSSKSCVFHQLVEISDKIGQIGQLARPNCVLII